MSAMNLLVIVRSFCLMSSDATRKRSNSAIYVGRWCCLMSSDVGWHIRDKLRRNMVQYCFTSTETRRLVRTDSLGRPPRLSHCSWTMSTRAIYKSDEQHVRLRSHVTRCLKYICRTTFKGLCFRELTFSTRTRVNSSTPMKRSLTFFTRSHT